MGIKERIFEHPLAAFTGCLTWIPLAIMIYALIAWMVQGDVDPVFGFVGVALCIVLGYLALVPPQDIYAPVICGICWFSVIGFPLVKKLFDHQQLAQIDIEAVERIYQALGQRPMNPSLRFRLAKLLYSRGLVQEAIAVAEKTMGQLPRQFFAEEHRELHNWHHALKGPKKESFWCFHCHNENAPGEIFCQSCGQPLMLPLAQGKWVGNQFLRQMLTVWVVIVSLVIGIPLATTTLQPWACVTVIMVLVVAAYYATVKVFFQSNRGSST